VIIRQLRSLYLRFRSSKNYSYDLDSILDATDPGAPLFDRLSWLVDLMQWVRYKSYLIDYEEVENVKLPIVRLRFLVALLDRNPEWKVRVAETLRSILIDTRDVELFASTGLPEEQGFWSEFFHRLAVKIMPARPLTEGGIQLFSALFPDRDDLVWFSEMPEEMMEKLIDLVIYEKPPEKSFAPVVHDIEDALLILVSQVHSVGLTYQIRRRAQVRLNESPFLELTWEVGLLLSSIRSGDRIAFELQSKEFQNTVGRCFEVFNQVYNYLDEHGVSLKVVYLLEIGRSKLKRINDLVDLLAKEAPDAKILIRFISQLIEENQDKHGIRSLIEQNTRLISQKIIERNADTGEHYIAKTRLEFLHMFKNAGGGGAYMSLAVVFKVLLGTLKLPDFIQGFVYSINYSFVFVGIQLQGFTLATKQPAMTGPALAAKLSLVNKGEPIDLVTDEIVKLIRSQIIGIIGNVGVVIPCIVAMDLVFYMLFDLHLIQSEALAEKLMNSSHPFSFAPVFAAFTGVLLWLSSILAGYVDNWFHLNRMKETILFNRRLNYVIGKSNSESLALFFEKNIAGLTSNISLAFFLGMIPFITAFLGLFLDVRHVTLSAGNLALGGMHYGWAALSNSDFWLSFGGLGIMGFMNVAVSFSLAFWVALKSRQMREGRKLEILKAVVARVKQHPGSFLFPPRG